MRIGWMTWTLVLTASGLSAGSAGAQDRGWIDVNFGSASSAQRSLATEFNQPDGRGEFNTYRVAYDSPRGGAFDVGAGFMVTRILGFGVALTGTAHKAPADLSIRIAHPFFFDAHANDSGPTEAELNRTEGGINLSIVAAVPMQNDQVTLRFFGGPTYFRLEADAVEDIRYEQQFQVFGRGNVVDITSYSTREVESTGWGFHGGADLGFFFNRHVGVGGFARFSRATLTVADSGIPADRPVDVKAGGFQAGGGLRIRF